MQSRGQKPRVTKCQIKVRKLIIIAICHCPSPWSLIRITILFFLTAERLALLFCLPLPLILSSLSHSLSPFHSLLPLSFSHSSPPHSLPPSLPLSPFPSHSLLPLSLIHKHRRRTLSTFAPSLTSYSVCKSCCTPKFEASRDTVLNNT